MSKEQDRTTHYNEGSLTLAGTVMLGTGVMIGAGIFALTGQMAEMTGALFPLAFLAAAVIVSFSSYSYIKISNAYPSAGGIGMYLHKAYGDRLPTAFHALLMYFSMVIAQSFLARTFGSYTMQLFGGDESGLMVPILGVSLILAAFVINLLGNQMVQGVASFIGVLKITGILIIGLVGVWLADSLAVDFSSTGETGVAGNFLGATALGILAFKGFTTITNSGSEVKDPRRNVGRAIIISIVACVVIYTLVGFAVASNLSLAEIIETRDYSLAAAARPVLGEYGVWFTVAIAMMATAGGILASIFAVSRMLAMLTEMKLVPHSHFGMSGSIQKHTLVYTVVLGLILTAFFDLSRIAALGIIFYLIMDIAIHWGVLRYLREDVKAVSWVPVVAIMLDLLALGGFVWVKLNSDPFVLGVAVVAMIVIAIGEQVFLTSSARKKAVDDEHAHADHH
ncbi:APC family permease [Halopseudomonas laoshanensis]|uniref:APC family permease n=2 Tax=Halopseudomonas TaxID=2901189 RepID=A0A7V7GUS7_9GAMM|nr:MULTISPECIES: APC family permease [Halopseudomonas]KAA0695292.1 APC family permease [Halopseudomonas laoshanensis]PCC97341.1 amino acid permease [Halopseudomonas pelagia]QFY58420.1 APC family permease [Halopseudomonas pelagia]WOD13324.1 APC family permease [Pseudomonas sp. NyZ704]